MIEAYFMLDGRMRRRGYLGFLLLLLVLVLIGDPLAIWAASYTPKHRMAAEVLTVVLLGGILTWANVALAAKRFHDLDKSGWFGLLLLPGFGASMAAQDGVIHYRYSISLGTIWVLTSFYLLFARGTDGPNRFGYPP